MKQILIFIDWFLPGYKAGGPIQSITNLVAHLGNELDISIVTSNADLGEKASYPNLIYNSWIQRDNYRVIYLDDKHQNRKQYKFLVREQAYDVIYFNSLFSPGFTFLPLLCIRKLNSKIILAPRGMLGEGALNIKRKKKIIYLSLFRLLGLNRIISWHATSETEYDEIRKHFGDDAVIDLASNLSKKVSGKLEAKEKKINELRLFFLSRIAYKKNLKRALEYLKKVESEIRIEFLIIGPVDEAEYWRECQTVISQLPSNIKVLTIGAVPNHELPAMLKDQHILLLPTLHENFGHVIMEAWQNGCPVIISDQTPWRGLESVRVGWDIPLNDPDGFVRAIETAAKMDSETYQQWSSSAVDYARGFCENPAVIEANRRLFEN